MFILGRAHLSHPAKHVLGSAVGGGWPLSQAQHWVANKSSAEPGSPSAGRQTTEGGRPWPGLTRPGPVRLARPAAATLTNTPWVSKLEWSVSPVWRHARVRRQLTQRIGRVKAAAGSSDNWKSGMMWAVYTLHHRWQRSPIIGIKCGHAPVMTWLGNAYRTCTSYPCRDSLGGLF
jgi:hypothetical protein